MNERPPPTLYVVAAPSGGGKSSLIRALLESDARLRLSVSHTTRPARPGEVEGQHYFFTGPDEFQRLAEAGAFLEHARVYDYRYGTSRSPIESQLEQGYDVLLDIDWQGAEQVRKSFPACCSIFLLPPSLQELERRLRSRGQDSEETIQRRMRKARDELSHAPEFEYLVVNDDFEAAVQDLLSIIRHRKHHRPGDRHRAQMLLAQLLENE